jgi:peroxiredoxin
MKKSFLFVLVIAGFCLPAFAKDGYKITLKFTDLKLKDSLVYLANYYGKALPSIYTTDSARFDKNNVAVFQSNEKILGGIYIMLLGDHKTYFEFLLDNGDEMSITATSTNLPGGLVFKGSPENERFIAYERFLNEYGITQQVLQKEIATAKSKKDSDDVRKRAFESSKGLNDYRENYIAKYPGSILANVFDALSLPQVPPGKHKLANGKEDSSFAYRYYKAHYWDKFNFKDDRLIHTPLYDAKLDEYMNKLVLPNVDSVEMEADMLLARTRGQKELFKYTLWWLKTFAQNSKIMGMDEVFVYLVEKYFMKGDADWLAKEDLDKHIAYAQKIAPNVLGNPAPPLEMQDIAGKQISLSSIKAKYTLLVFWAPDCGHCQVEMPKIDSLYRSVLKAKGVKIYAVRVEDDPQTWQKYIKEHHLEDWTHVYDPERHSDFRTQYNVYTTPVIYLLDEKKNIIGKRIDHTSILRVIEMHERSAKGS